LPGQPVSTDGNRVTIRSTSSLDYLIDGYPI
jgi:hypothetical protein